MTWQLKKNLLLLLSCGLVLFGSAQLISQLRLTWPDWLNFKFLEQPEIVVKHNQQYKAELKGAFPVERVDEFAITRGGKDVFSLLLAHYLDSDKQPNSAVLFPNQHGSTLMPSPTGLRQEIWQEAAKALSQNTAEVALIVSWWDEGQRIHFLSGRHAWLNKPSKETFLNPIWKHLQNDLQLASEPERQKLAKMAKWLTMDSEKALAEIRQYFGSSKPIYLLITNDLLIRLKELADYGGKALLFNSTTVPVREDLHGDIAQIKRIAFEQGDGNYLVQKEGTYYHVWFTTKQSSSENNSLLVRLLPFVESLKKLPAGVKLVYQSNWGAYLSIYRIG
jgi:hydroxylamine oxidation protein HaoB